jgi:DNA-binding SARP family transcriptional activator
VAGSRLGDEDGDRETTAPVSRQDARLLACLALHPQGITTSTLLEILWPDAKHRGAGQRLRTALNHLRTTLREATDLPEATFAGHLNGRYHLGAHPGDRHIWVDHTAFDTAAHSLRTRTGQARIDALHTIASLYTGLLLDGIDLDWPELSGRQESARQSATAAVAELAEHYEHTDPAQAIDLLRTLLSHDPAAEQPAEQLIALYIRGGNVRGAHRAYRQLAKQLAALGRRPSAAVTDAIQAQPRPSAENLFDTATAGPHR